MATLAENTLAEFSTTAAVSHESLALSIIIKKIMKTLHHSNMDGVNYYAKATELLLKDAQKNH